MNEWQEGIDALNTSMSNIGSCMPAQVVQLTFAVNDFTNYQIFNGNGCQYDNSCMEVAWSYDGTTWSCFADYDSAMKSLINASSDYFVKFKVKGERGQRIRLLCGEILDENGEFTQKNMQIKKPAKEFGGLTELLLVSGQTDKLKCEMQVTPKQEILFTC